MVNFLACNPILVCLNKIGPFELDFIIMLVIIRIGLVNNKAKIENKISINLLKRLYSKRTLINKNFLFLFYYWLLLFIKILKFKNFYFYNTLFFLVPLSTLLIVYRERTFLLPACVNFLHFLKRERDYLQVL